MPSTPQRLDARGVATVLTGAPACPDDQVVLVFAEALQSVINGFEDLGALAPDAVMHPLQLISQVYAGLRADTDPCQLIATTDDVTTLSAERLVELLRRQRDTGPLQGRNSVTIALLQRAADEYAAVLPDVLHQLFAQWTAAAEVVHRAAAAGITPSTTAAEVIDLGDDAVTAWRDLATVGTDVLDHIWTLRCQALLVTGHYVAPARTPRLPAADTDALAARLNGVPTEVDEPAIGVLDGFALHGRDAWLTVAHATTLSLRTELIPARRHHRRMNQLERADQPDQWALEAARLATPVATPADRDPDAVPAGASF